MEKRPRRISQCPHCGNQIEVRVTTNIEVEVVAPEFVPANWLDTLSEDERAVLKEVRDKGILPVFEAVTKVVKQGEMPRNVENFFLVFLKTAKKSSLPRSGLDWLIRQFSGANIQFWASQGIGAVTADGVLKLFAPSELFKGRAITNLSGAQSRGVIRANEADLQEWTKHRFGYLSGEGIYFEAMRVRSIGEFSRLNQ